MKRILALLLALVMLLAMTACGKEEEGTPTGESTEVTTNTTESTNDPTDGAQDSTQGTTESATGGNTTEATEPPATAPSATPPTTEAPTLGGATTSGTSAEQESPSKTQIETFVNNHIGRWYLEGYSDVYVDFYVEPTTPNTLFFSSYNFHWYEGGWTPRYIEYPAKYCLENNMEDKIWAETGRAGSGFPCSTLKELNANLTTNDVVLGNDYVSFGNRKFVKEQGSKNVYSGTCYPEVLGTWYLYNNPEVTITIRVHQEGESASGGDYIQIESRNIDLASLSTGYKYHDLFEGWACLKSFWQEHGITVSNEVLTVSNNSQTKTFYRYITGSTIPEPSNPPTTEPPATMPQSVRVSGVQISKTTLSLKVGDTQQLTATVSPSNADNKNVTWSSSNSSVAQVSTTGKITAKGEGTAVITVTTKDGGYTASCNVAVSVVHVNEVSLNQTALNMTIGKSQQLMATVFPSNADNKNVTWSSSNSSVAQVSSTGTVTAKGIGSAIITVSTVDGSYTATCTVTVQSPPAAEQLSDVLIISGAHTISNQTINTDVYITSTGVATFNNVTINGNIYCYGQLKCSGCTANNVYAYAYGSMMSCGAFDGTHGKVSGGISCNEITILDNALDYAFSKWGKK